MTEPRRLLRSSWARTWTARILFAACAYSLAACASSASPAMAPKSGASFDAAPSMVAPSPMPAGGYGQAEARTDSPAAPPPPGALAANAAQAPTSPDSRPGKEPARVDTSQGPMLIYTANIGLAVKDVTEKLHDVEAVAQRHGGFLARRDDHAITIRVPQAHFQDALSEIAKLGDVLHRDTTAEDVTEEFADLDVRLKSARATRDRFEQLLAKATNVNDAVTIERELSRVVGEIERLEGRMKFLRDRAAYSTITVSLEQRTTPVVTKKAEPRVHLPFPWLEDLGLERLRSL